MNLNVGSLGAADAAPAPFEVERLGARLGAQVHGLDLKQEMSPQTLRAFLRAHVAAIRLARADRDLAVKVLVDQVKYQPSYAGRAYDENMPGFDERGRLPDDEYMDVFWSIAIAGGTAREPWPASRLLDARFIGTFAEWAP